MAEHVFFDPDLEWLDHVQPVGLVVAPNLIKELGLIPERQTQAETAEVAELIETELTKSALADPWAFMSRVLGWDACYVAGAPGGPAVPETLAVRLPEHETTLSPTWAVRELSEDAANNASPWQLLVRIEEGTVDPDERGALGGWEATAQQRFERLLRETGVFAGILISTKEMRLVYAPRGETSGWLSFPLRDLASVSGRPMLAGLKLILGSYRLFNDAKDRRLPALLKRSRDAQAAVSSKLAEQVLGALHELLRGLDRAESALIRGLAKDCPGHLYEGLLAVLMRLVFILYAEDRDLIPSRTDTQARALYDENYSVRGLFAKLVGDAALNSDTMDERLGAWGRLIALFRLVHKGDISGWIKGRGGKLFDPDAFPFLEGRETAEDTPHILKVPDGFVLRILEGLMTIENKRGTGQQQRARERLSYRTLDVEQIGSVYETVMGFTVETASGSTLAIRAGKKNNVPVFVNLDELAGKSGVARLKWLKEKTGRDKFGARVEAAIKAAKSASDLAVVFASVVDSRGSPNEAPVAAGTPILQPTDERRRTGSHYTPRSLTEPIVRHALEPAFERLGLDAKPEEILDLKVCDPAMGSGAFLVEVCRALADRLTEAWKRWPETRPNIPTDEYEELHAKRLVAQRCLYGVDKNPMAADLSKLSLWLATLARDHEFEFVDHALKSGDSLVGLTNEQIMAAAWADGGRGLPLFGQMVRERIKEATKMRAEIRDAPDDVFRAIQEVRHKNLEIRLDPVRQIGDAVIAAFFSEAKPKAREHSRQMVESYTTAHLQPDWDKLSAMAAKLRQGEHPIRPFHWQLEFPEVFARKNPGFDAIIGNPPFAGKNTISAGNRSLYPDWLKTLHKGAHGNADLAAHFYLRAFGLLRHDGTFGLIASNTIAQGDTRDTGLATILAKGGAISRATRRHKWQGAAAVVTSFVHIKKGKVHSSILDGRQVRRISAYLVEGDLDLSPKPLAANRAKAFQGTIVLGEGFAFDDRKAANGETSSIADMQALIERGPHNAERIRPFLGWEEVSNDPGHAHRRYVIDFEELSEAEARRGWPDLLAIIERLVKGTRASHSTAPWWLFERRRSELYRAIAPLNRVLVTGAGAAAHHMFAVVPSNAIYSNKLIVFAMASWSHFAVLSSRAHEMWSSSFGATRGVADDLTYNPTDVFANFPFPAGFEISSELDAAGQSYHEHRAALMIARNEGLTKTYNRFHNPTENTPDIVRLRELHAAMDVADLRAYGWADLAEKARPEHLDETNEDDHKYQGRYFWLSDFRDTVLSRLLELNAERAEEERRAGLMPAVGDEEETDIDEGDEE